MRPRVVGPWSLEQIEQFFTAQTIPLRLGCRTASGWPLVVSHWYLYRDGALWCATQTTASIVRHLRADSRCAFEVATNEAPYRGVRGQARAHVVPDAGTAVLRDLIHRYLGGEDSDFARWLLARTANETAIRLDPVRLRSWDFTRRMRQ